MRKIVLYTLMSLDGDVDDAGYFTSSPEPGQPPVFGPGDGQQRGQRDRHARTRCWWAGTCTTNGRAIGRLSEGQIRSLLPRTTHLDRHQQPGVGHQPIDEAVLLQGLGAFRPTLAQYLGQERAGRFAESCRPTAAVVTAVPRISCSTVAPTRRRTRPTTVRWRRGAPG